MVIENLKNFESLECKPTHCPSAGVTSTCGIGNEGNLNDVGYVSQLPKRSLSQSNSLYPVLVDCRCQQVDVFALFNRRASASFGQGNGPNMIMLFQMIS